ncbi:MAG: DUF4149 domain-containing protein [Deltaproteobacteria bacterium]|nr:DUF4149 domain-containing protein [Deltaproteobacteria bacterium]
MPTLAKVALQLALSLWLGALVAVSLVVAPAVFRAVPGETAGTVMGHVFPLYYAFTMAAGLVALAAATWLWRRSVSARLWRALVPMLVVMLAATAYAGAVVSPRARALRPALHHEPVDPAIRAEFDRLHRRAMQLNGLVLLLGFVAVAGTAAVVRWPGEC